MRKIYKLASGLACLGLMFSTININAQSVSDFESLTLSPNTYWDGSDLSGLTTPKTFTTDFMSGDASFNNVFDTAFGGPGYWSEGFAQSTYTDSITSGSGNLYSSRAGSGNASQTYLVAKNNTKITLKNAATDTVVSGIYITNSTYAANSMRDGDSFAKKFGGVSGNDADWFLLTIKGIDTTGAITTDSVDFYLADFRFATNSLDYIVKDWQYVNLASLGNVTALTFTLTSSDVSGIWMNTPTFFCIDDITPISATLIDFEDLGFTVADSAWDGADYTGVPDDLTYRTTFSDSDADFKNVWNIGWGGYWESGFAYSSKTDSVTSGYLNTYSARTAIGYNNSSNYLISKNKTKAYLTGTAANNTLSGLYVTNTTYAANSMRDGDFFGKQFGSVNNASGNPDGTNGNDWFLLTIKGYSGGNITTDSVNFYLADYRFTSSAQDYIVTDWQWVDLTSLGAVDSLSFILTSSDVGLYGMNTPAFFALDNLNDQTVSVNELNDKLSFLIYPNPANENVFVSLNSNITELQIIDVTGKTVRIEKDLFAGTHNINLENLKSGIYLVKIMSENQIKIEKFIKQ
ncbi:MAG: hypothetical protein COB15_01605 [Flavobacteriales bacterium]|nr:MAG: hypothetical protein COB15_01605 [Flavobacteriales bacterium]